MKYTRREGNGGLAVLLRFEMDEGEILTDTMIREVMKKEGLRTSGPKENLAYAISINCVPKMPLVLFDTKTSGTESPGSVVIDKFGEPRVIEDRTRGKSGEEWDASKWEFLFARADQSAEK